VNKKWWSSKLLWLNVVATLIAIMQLLQGFTWFPAQYQVLILGILNAILRIWFTDKNLTT